MQKNKIGSGVMSALAWNAKRILLLLSWIFVCVVLMIVLPEHKIISFIIAVLFAATGTAYGHKIEYSNEKLSSVRAQAVTTCTTANNVEATINVIYTDGEPGKFVTKTATGITAISATANINGYINTITSHHKVWVLDQGQVKTWEKSLP